MAVDLQIEIFAVDLFNVLWKDMGYDYDLGRPKKYEHVSPEIVEGIPLCMRAVSRRRLLFLHMIHSPLYNDRGKYSKNGIDFYYYLRKFANDFIAYDGLNIYDKMFMTCAVVCEMCDIIHNESDLHKYVAPLAWAMFFETTSRKEFYAAGGWLNLIRYVHVYYSKPLTSIDLKVGLTTNALESIQVLYENQEVDYDLNQIYKEFKKKMSGRTDKPCCPMHLPQFEILHAISYSGGTVDTDYKTIEGYLQLLLRMMWKKDLKAIEKKWNLSMPNESGSPKEKVTNPVDLLEEDFKLSRQIKLEKTSVLLNNIFNVKEPTICIFCDPNKRGPISADENEVDKVDHITSVVKRTLAEIKSSKTEEPTSDQAGKSKPTSSKDESKKIEEKIALRLFLALGMEPALTKMRNNIKQEFPEDEVTESLSKLEIQDGSKVQTPKKNRNRRKRK